MSIKETAAKTALILYIIGDCNGNPMSVQEIANRSETSYTYCKEILTGLASDGWVVTTDHGYLVPFTRNIEQASQDTIDWMSAMFASAYEFEPARPRFFWQSKWLDTDDVMRDKKKR